MTFEVKVNGIYMGTLPFKKYKTLDKLPHSYSSVKRSIKEPIKDIFLTISE